MSDTDLTQASNTNAHIAKPAVMWAALVRIGVALLLIAAAVFKGYDITYGPGISSPWSITQVTLEWLLGVWLLSGIQPNWSWRASLIVFIVFIPVAATRAIAGETSCGCFGGIQINPWITLTIDIAVVTALLLTRHSLQQRQWAFPVQLAITASAVCLTTIGLWIMLTNQPETLNTHDQIEPINARLTIEPDTWLNQPLPLLPYIDIEKQLAQGNWQLLFYRHDCPHCREVIANAIFETGPESTLQYALIEVPPFGQLDEADAAHALGWTRGQLSDKHQWLFQTPLQVTIGQGIVAIAQ